MSEPAPLLLLPGLICDDRLWAAQVEALADHDPVGRARLSRRADRLPPWPSRAWRRAPPTFSLAGHSMGGRVALEILRMAPERVERLALLDTGVHPPSERRSGQAPGPARGRAERRDRGDGRSLAAADGPPGSTRGRRLHGAVAGDGRGRRRPTLCRPDRGDDRSARSAARCLPLIHCPTLIGVGRQDEWSPVAQNREIAAAIKSADFAIFEDCGHMAPVEAPDQVSAALRRWLEAAGPCPPRSRAAD
jgi:pimeloyl-ACP methyl ester carboxylesterase